MKAFVIAIEDHEKSQQVADRCIKSASRFDIKIEKWKATTPQDMPIDLLMKEGVNVVGLHETYSRVANCAAAFHSHYSLWKNAVETQEMHMIFEHDAVVINDIPKTINFEKVVSIGAPSYGKFNTPSRIGVGPLVSKRYFPGAHGYIVKPDGAALLMKQAKVVARPTDVFLNLETFPWLEEYYPWAVEARDSFTTIQNVNGCLAKHSYGEAYRVEEV